MDVTVELHCDQCGSANLTLPAPADESSAIACNDCRAEHGTLAELRQELLDCALAQSAEALRETVRAGLGVTLLPRGYAAPSDRDLIAIPLTHPTPKREVLLVQRGPGQLRTPRAVGAFTELLVAAARA
jgi:DNA-binding transcriptional LysR family regulator